MDSLASPRGVGAARVSKGAEQHCSVHFTPFPPGKGGRGGRRRSYDAGANLEERPIPAYIALLRAVNVGGTGKLPMAELKAMCEAEGFAKVRTYIASGNVVFETKATPKRIKAALEARLAAYAGKAVGVVLRSAAEMAAVRDANPFPEAAPNRAVAIFLDEAPPANALDDVKGLQDEELRLGRREIYVHYGAGMAQSKLKIPAATAGTARNMNTVAKLAEMAAAL